jgi:hypothetical protein
MKKFNKIVIIHAVKFNKKTGKQTTRKMKEFFTNKNLFSLFPKVVFVMVCKILTFYLFYLNIELKFKLSIVFKT